MYSVDHNDTFDHMYCTERDTLLNILNIMLKYQYLAAAVLNLKGGSVILGPDPFQTNVPFYSGDSVFLYCFTVFRVFLSRLCHVRFECVTETFLKRKWRFKR